MRRLVVAGGSYLSGMPLETYFGLGDADTADVTVTWTDGHTRTWEDVASGTLLRAEREADR